MPKRPHLFLLLVLLITACQAHPAMPPVSTPASVDATDTPEPTVIPTPTPTASSTDGWRELLSYISPEWLNVHSVESPLGSVTPSEYSKNYTDSFEQIAHSFQFVK